MPTYEYECTKCAHRFEKFQSMSAEPIKTCPKCKKKVRRLIGKGAGIIFKGGGFYETDYRSASYQKKAESEKKSSTPDSKSDKSKSPAKETKTDTPSKKETT
jgi:putative FmdB family regulatory protein